MSPDYELLPDDIPRSSDWSKCVDDIAAKHRGDAYVTQRPGWRSFTTAFGLMLVALIASFPASFGRRPSTVRFYDTGPLISTGIAWIRDSLLEKAA